MLILPEMPLTLIEKITRKPRIAAAVARSPFTGGAQVQDFLGEWLTYQITFAQHTRAEGRRLSAFFDSLRGPTRPFLLRDPSMRPLNAYAGVPKVYGSGQLGEYLATSGWVAGATIAMGDYFNVTSPAGDLRTYRVVADATANSSGRATLQLFPSLREVLSSGAVLSFATPGIALRLTSPVPTNIEAAEKYRFSVDAEEFV